MTARDAAARNVDLGSAFDIHASEFIASIALAQDANKSEVVRQFVARMVGQERMVRAENDTKMLQRIAELERKLVVRESTAVVVERLQDAATEATNQIDALRAENQRLKAEVRAIRKDVDYGMIRGTRSSSHQPHDGRPEVCGSAQQTARRGR